MKKTIFILLATYQLTAQPVPPGINLNEVTEIGFSNWQDDNREKRLSVMRDSENCYYIEGDSLQVIQMLFERMEDLMNKISDKDLVIQAGVEWSNTVSDKFKENKQWKEFIRKLLTQGYKLSNKK